VAAVRTFRYTLNARFTPDLNISISTEEIVNETFPDDVKEAGVRAGKALSEFLDGISSSLSGDEST
jgi:hypothetical protein